MVLGGQLSSIRARLTLSRHHTLFAILAVTQCVVQLGLHTHAFVADVRAGDIATELMHDVDDSLCQAGIPLLSHAKLEICDALPRTVGQQCVTIYKMGDKAWNASQAHELAGRDHFVANTAGSSITFPTFTPATTPSFTVDSSITPGPSPTAPPATTTSTRAVTPTVAGAPSAAPPSPSALSSAAASGPASVQCARAMVFPKDVVADLAREDAVTMFFQVWLLALGASAVLRGSMPHMAAQLAGHVLNTGWAGFRVRRMFKVEREYGDLVVDGACAGADVLAGYWRTWQVPTIFALVFSAIMLLATMYLSIWLLRSYSRHTYERVGASPQLTRVHKLYMAFSMTLHGGYFVLAGAVLWLTKINMEPFRTVVPHQQTLTIVGALAAVVAPLWVLAGTYAICLECRWRFALFCTLGAYLLGAWAFMTASPAYTYSFQTNPFFATVSVAAAVFLVAGSALGVMCRLHFGEGLAHFLRVQDILARDGFTAASFDDDAPPGAGSVEKGSDAASFQTAELGLPRTAPAPPSTNRTSHAGGGAPCKLKLASSRPGSAYVVDLTTHGRRGSSVSSVGSIEKPGAAGATEPPLPPVPAPTRPGLPRGPGSLRAAGGGAAPVHAHAQAPLVPALKAGKPSGWLAPEAWARLSFGRRFSSGAFGAMSALPPAAVLRDERGGSRLRHGDSMV